MPVTNTRRDIWAAWCTPGVPLTPPRRKNSSDVQVRNKHSTPEVAIGAHLGNAGTSGKAPDPPMTSPMPQSGAVIADKYVVESMIGRGGMGAVYVVVHRVTQKRLALKVLLPQYLDQPEIVERFLREAQAVGRIQHRNVVDVFDVGKDGDIFYIVMALLNGKPLSTLLREEPMPLSRLLTISLRAMEGVAAAHAEGVIHRDLKPDNIYVCKGVSGQLDDPKIVDFGISKQEGAIDTRLTQSGVMLGTPHYMAFEQITGQRDLDERVDVYAVGAILYEAMAGEPPYDAESVGGLAVRMMSGPPQDLDERCSGLPHGLSDVIMRALSRERDQRFGTMDAFIAALRPYANPTPVTNHLTSLAPRESLVHGPTLLAQTPSPSPSGSRSLDGGSGLTPIRQLTLSLHDDEARPRAKGVESTPTRPAERGTHLGRWVALGLLAVAVPLVAALLRTSPEVPAAEVTQSQQVPAATPLPAAPTQRPAARGTSTTAVQAESPTPAIEAPEITLPPTPPADDELLPDSRTELGGRPVVSPEPEPGKSQRGVRGNRPYDPKRPWLSGRNDGRTSDSRHDDASPTNPPLSAPSGEPVALPPAPAPAAVPVPAPEAPAPAAPAPDPNPYAEPSAPASPAPSEDKSAPGP
jgi:serine/threonine protein kinase